MDPRLKQALDRGVEALKELVAAEGGHMSAREAAFRLEVSVEVLENMYQAHQVVGMMIDGELRVFRWQFDADDRLLAGLGEVLRALDGMHGQDDAGRLLFFLQPRHSLNRRRPLDLLRDGEIERVVWSARDYVGE